MFIFCHENDAVSKSFFNYFKFSKIIEMVKIPYEQKRNLILQFWVILIATILKLIWQFVDIVSLNINSSDKEIETWIQSIQHTYG